MQASPPPRPRAPAARSPLPDFCRLPALFALMVVGTLTTTVMWLARDSGRDWSAYSLGILFVTWLVLVVTVALCKSRPVMQLLPGHAPYAGVWLTIVVIVTVASMLARWIDSSLQMHLIGSGATFVRDNMLIAALLGAAILRYFYVLTQWQDRLAAVTHARVEALQARIRPHFLFNSMNTVAALIRVDPAAAERTVEDLSELFRAALGPYDTGDGTLGEELELIERYLAIEQLRLGSRLSVRRELEHLPYDFPLPRLLLQPLVENAVRHGIQPLLNGGEVTLRGFHDKHGVHIDIVNPLPTTPSPSGNGHGLHSVRQRVAYRYGPLARMDAGPQDERFVVSLFFPRQTSHAHPDR